MEKKRVCVVGAGVSGLAVCKHLVEKGFQPVVFEACTAVGGQWTRTPASTRLQTSRNGYRFTDFPWSESVKDEFPDSKQVVEYLESYARRFCLHRYVRFNRKVVAAEYVGVNEEEIKVWDLWSGSGDAFAGGRGEWHVTVETSERPGSTEVHATDFLVLCIGRFSGLPAIPTFPTNKGPEVFEGKAIHSMDYADMGSFAAAQLVKGKRVTIVGFLKSALDIAVECANINGPENPCTMLVRTNKWNVPSLAAWGVPLQYLFFNRFSELLFHKPEEGIMLSVLATFLAPLAWLISKFTDSYFKKVMPLQKYGVAPEHSFFNALAFCALSLLPENFYDRVEEGSIVLKPSKAFEFGKNGVRIDGEASVVESDVVIFATGYQSDQKLRDIFLSQWFKDIVAGSENTTVPLYRHCIHPQIPQMAVIGYCESASNIHTYEMGAKWLACFLDGGFRLPSKRRMEKSVMEWDSHSKKYSGKNFRRSCLAYLHNWYIDQLCNDMGYNPRLKKGFLAYLFLPHSPADYADLESKDK
ncbi:hypothetical protein HPP92_019856 [Vanilla planifolia]|uniref:Flavin-containing monooxygenase n=1 Tax=Vanilla planifolia TaxID=51239 RepID=A0A835QAG1_VANPL|nr:hypothetical protein HPP92_019856 [Vanilla planifolia]